MKRGRGRGRPTKWMPRGIPLKGLIMLIDERSLSGYSDLQTIVNLPNQNIDPTYDDLTAMTAVWWHPTNSARIWRSNQKLNGYPVVRLHQAYASSQASYSGLSATSERVPGTIIAGNTMSFVVRPDSSFWVQNSDSYTTAMGQAILGLCTYRYGAGNYGNNYVSGLAKSGRLVHTNPANTITRNWAIFENGAGDQSVPPGREINAFDPHIDGEWVHILYVEDFGSTTNNVKIYIDGQLIFAASTTRPQVYNDVRKIYFGNHGNPLYRMFAGELAHFAVWKRPLTNGEVNAVWGELSGKYGITPNVQKPVINTSNIHVETKLVTITCATNNSVIRYTTDGSDPNETSPIYISPISVNESSTVKAKAYKAGWDASPIATSVIEIATFGFEGGVVDVVSSLYVTAANSTFTCKGGISWRIGGSGDFITTPLSVNGAVEIQVKRTSSAMGYIFTPMTITRYGTGDAGSASGYRYASGGAEAQMPNILINVDRFSRSAFTSFSSYIASANVETFIYGTLETCSSMFISGSNVYWTLKGRISNNIGNNRIVSNNVDWIYSGTMNLSSTLTLNGNLINRQITGFTGTNNCSTFQLLNWRTDKATDAEIIVMLDSLRTRTGNLPATITINDYKAVGSVPQNVLDAATALINSGKGVTTVVFGA